LASIHRRLEARYGDLGWWPADTPYAVMVGAVLTQNTAWRNVERALANFDGPPTPAVVRDLPLDQLAAVIRPAGFCNQKAVCLKTLTAWFEGYGDDPAAVRRQPLARLRSELLALRGIGPETADSILLYAFGRPSFVIDAYTLRLCRRHPIPVGPGYAGAQAHFQDRLPRSVRLYNNFHAPIVINAKEHCRKQPLCQDCPLHDSCRRLDD
jgi:endonuclease-3 related protein